MSLEKECDKHPIDFMGLSPKEFAEGFGNTNYFYQKECFKELKEEYKRQEKGDKKRNRIQLSSGLGNLAIVFYLVVRAMDRVCKVCSDYMENPYKK